MTASAHAQPVHFRLVLVQPENSELIPRVEGQTRDLGVTLQVVARGWSSGSADQAAAIAAEQGADFVARVQRSSQGTLEVRVYAAAQRSLRARRVPAPRGDRLATSAELEAAALVLRGELTALIEAERDALAQREAVSEPAVSSPAAAASGGGPTGTTSSRASRSQQLPSTATTPSRVSPAATPKRAPSRGPTNASDDTATDEEDEAEPEDEPSEPLESYTTHRSAWTLRGGVRASFPLQSAAVGGLIGARLPLSVLEVGLAFSTAVPFELSDPNVRIALWRSALTAEALAVIPAGPRLRALLGVDLGAVLYARSTDRVAPGYSAAGSKNAWSATLGVQAELQWLLSRQFGVALGAGVSYLPQRTRFSYTAEGSSQPHEIAALRSLEPHASASLFGLFGE